MPEDKKAGNLSRRAFLAASTSAVPFAASALTTPAPAPAAVSAISQASKKRNVLFICCDDLTPRIGSFGDPIVKTPNLDRLAGLGVRFERNYCQYPLCAPSRTSLMTGLAPDTTKVWDLNTDFRKTMPGEVLTLPQLFQKNGYFTARAGKIYHYNNPSEIGTPGFDDAASWQASSYPAGYDRTHDESLVTFYASQENMFASLAQYNRAAQATKIDATSLPWAHGGKGPSGIRIAQDGRTPILPLTRNGDLGVAIAGHPSDGSDEVMTDYMVAESAIAMIEEHRNDPWFIGSGFFRPHVPFIVPSKYFDLYKLEDIQLPPFASEELKSAPSLAYLTSNANYGMTEQQHREAIRGHYAAISFVDAQVGRLLDVVKRLELEENTTIVFWSDHGFMVGEHGQWEKTMLFDASVHVPLFIAGAGVSAKGKACRRTVEHLNIYPTLAELCELEGTPRNLHAKSLMPLLSNPEAAWDYPSISQVGRRVATGPVMGYSLRTERYRYTSWGVGGAEGEELYDYDLDPHETKNLASVASASDLKSRLRTQLEQISAARRSVATGS